MVVRAVKLSIELDRKEHPPRHGVGTGGSVPGGGKHGENSDLFHDRHQFLFSVLQFEKSR